MAGKYLFRIDSVACADDGTLHVLPGGILSLQPGIFSRHDLQPVCSYHERRSSLRFVSDPLSEFTFYFDDDHSC